MTGEPPRHPSPYPGGTTPEERLAQLEGWRGTVDEWRRGVDSWRKTIEREGLVTAVAVMGTKLDQVMKDVGEMKGTVNDLDDERNRRRGVTLTGRSLAVAVGALASLGTIIGLLIALVTGSPP